MNTLTRALLITSITALAAFSFACGDDDDDTSGATPTTAAAASPTPGTSTTPTAPAGSPTGESEGTPTIVNDIIDAVESGDAAAIEGMLVYTSLECATTVEGLGGPPQCAAGEAAGTEVDVLPTAFCEGSYARPGELNTFPLTENITFYAAYRVTDDFYPPGDYVVVFSRTEPNIGGETALAIIADDRGIVGVHFGCAQTIDQFIDFQQLTDVIIEPAAP